MVTLTIPAGGVASVALTQVRYNSSFSSTIRIADAQIFGDNIENYKPTMVEATGSYGMSSYNSWKGGSYDRYTISFSVSSLNDMFVILLS